MATAEAAEMAPWMVTPLSWALHHMRDSFISTVVSLCIDGDVRLRAFLNAMTCLCMTLSYLLMRG